MPAEWGLLVQGHISTLLFPFHIIDSWLSGCGTHIKVCYLKSGELTRLGLPDIQELYYDNFRQKPVTIALIKWREYNRQVVFPDSEKEKEMTGRETETQKRHP